MRPNGGMIDDGSMTRSMTRSGRMIGNGREGERLTDRGCGFLFSRVNHSRVAKQTRTAKRGARVSARAFDDVNITISAANALALSLGRYVFLPYQRAQVERVGLPTQNGETHFDAGDARAKEASFITTTKDPAGFITNYD